MEFDRQGRQESNRHSRRRQRQSDRQPGNPPHQLSPQIAAALSRERGQIPRSYASE